MYVAVIAHPRAGVLDKETHGSPKGSLTRQIAVIVPSSGLGGDRWSAQAGTPVMKLDRRIKTALDETRLLILGSQVLFGFLLESAFQNGFDALPGSSQYLVCAALGLMVLSIGCLIAPSMQHRIVEAGQSTPRLERATSVLAAWSLLPFMASLGFGAIHRVPARFRRWDCPGGGRRQHRTGGVFCFGLAWLVGEQGKQTMATRSGPTPLSTKVEQMLTEARVIIPGCQALLGFQLIAMLTRAFDELPIDAKIMHAAALCCVTIATILLMTPAARHREAFGGDEVFLKITHSIAITIAAGVTLLLAMSLLWYLYPMWLRARQEGLRFPAA